MITTNVHHEVGAAWAVTGHPYQSTPATIKLGVDVHQGSYTVVVQEDHATPRPAQRFLPAEFVPWVGRLLARGHRVIAVYEACGFGFGLQRALAARGAECYVVAPCRLDERRERVKTDGRDATALCQRLSRFVDGNRRELAVIRVPTEEEERLRAEHRQREALVRARTRLAAQGRALIVNHTGAPHHPAHLPARYGGGPRAGRHSPTGSPHGCANGSTSCAPCSPCSMPGSPPLPARWKTPPPPVSPPGRAK